MDIESIVMTVKLIDTCYMFTHECGIVCEQQIHLRMPLYTS